MQIKTLLVFYLLFLSGTLLAQQPHYNQRPEFLKANNIWAFGFFAGLDFSSGSPVPIETAMTSFEGSASVADRHTGALLFYSNGGKVWNANHQVMPNGSGLLGNPVYYGMGTDSIQYTSTVQGVCIVPVIDDTSKYYLFSLSGTSSGGPKPEGTLFYNVVDMNLENGLGNVVAGQKNLPLDTAHLFEGMIAVPGDDCDIWLIVHHASLHQFRAYHITREGIDTTPVLSNFTTGLNLNWYGGLAISPDRTKMAMASSGSSRTLSLRGGVIIAEFDPATGQITNDVIVSDMTSTVSGWQVCFSPDNSKLYISEAGISPAFGLCQVDLTTYDSASIVNSFALISEDAGKALKLYNDTIYNNNIGSLNRVNAPNQAGVASAWQGEAINLLTGTSTGSTFNTDVVFPLPKDTIYSLALDTATCVPDLTLSAPQGFETYLWDDGSSATDRAITAAGTYWVLSKDFCNSRIDTFTVSEIDLTPPVIIINERILGTVATYATYQWMFNGSTIAGATNSTFTVSENGDYQVIVTNEQGCTDTSEVYEVTNATGIGDRNDFADQIRVYPNPVKERVYIQAPMAVSVSLFTIDGRLIKMAEDVKQMDVSTLPRGVYFLKIRDLKGRLLKSEKIVK